MTFIYFERYFMCAVNSRFLYDLLAFFFCLPWFWFYSSVFMYLKVRNFRGKKISRILRICLEFAKLNSRENFSFLHLLWLGSTMDVKNSYFHGSTNIERKPFCLPVCQPIHGKFWLKYIKMNDLQNSRN